MGNIFPQISNLKEKPHLFEATLKLIEKSFHYQAPHSFKTDFAPLVDEANHQNCFILIDENEDVIGHIGVREVILRLNNKAHTIAMLGGIAVAEEYRGQGHFQQLMHEVLAEKRGDVAFFLLWSDQEKLYRKFGFHLCGEQFELAQQPGTAALSQTKLAALSSEEKEQLRELCHQSFQRHFLAPERTSDDWAVLEKITGSDLYLKRSGEKITDYLFMNKGQDLGGIIFEYGSTRPLSELLQEARTMGKVWMPQALISPADSLFQFSLAPGDSKRLGEFIAAYTKGLITLRRVDLLKDEVYFDFGDETLLLELPEFLRGILGPGPFEELGELKPVFISGLDSI